MRHLTIPSHRIGMDKGEITVEGIPLQDYLQEEVGKQAIKEMNRAIHEKEICRPKRVFKPLLMKSGKTGRGRKLTQREIRRIDPMAVTKIELVIECVKQNGPMTVREIAEKLKFKPTDVGTIAFRLRESIPDLFERIPGEDPYRYRIGRPEISSTNIYKEYLTNKPKRGKEQFPGIIQGKLSFSPELLQKEGVEIPIVIKITVLVEVKK